ncbi:MAG: HlyD family type I secretion periplasmic adaptor subunit, partial [Sphingomonadales bacterium]|nr:HlyD family type I secretion periplasmic adaptor subunit [Sphingomonadales bacterium]
VWASLAELDRTVRGVGRVVPGPQLQTVSNLEGGIVEAILVEVGDNVEVNDPLVRLDQTQTTAAMSSNRGNFEALDIKMRRLQAEIRGEQPRFPRPTSPAMADQIAIERALYSSRMADLASITQAARARITQASRAVSEAQANYAARVAARDAAQSEVSLLRPLVERGIEPRFSLTQAENRLSVSSHDAQAASASIGRAQASVAEAQASLNQARQDWRSRAADQLATVQAEQAALRRNLPAFADRLERTVVRAPRAGRINRVLVTTVGGTVAPGAPIVEIVPSDETLVVEARISPSDIAQVRVGERARVELTAYRSIVYGYLEGEVTVISPDTVQDEQTGEYFYTVHIATSGSLRDEDGNPLPVAPGMIANVQLLGDKQTVLDYILTPLTRLGESALRE